MGNTGQLDLPKQNVSCEPEEPESVATNTEASWPVLYKKFIFHYILLHINCIELKMRELGGDIYFI